MIRLVIRSTDEAGAVNVGSPVDISYKTFDVELPEVERFLLEYAGKPGSYITRTIIGSEVVANPAESDFK
jgi:hypothetical protein